MYRVSVLHHWKIKAFREYIRHWNYQCTAIKARRRYLLDETEVIQEFGFPVISKEVAAKIELLQNPSEKNKTVRHAIITGETGEYGGWQKIRKCR